VRLARWMRRFEYGVFIYVWTWVLMIGSVADTGLSSSARRFIPEYTEGNGRICADLERLVLACVTAAAGALVVWIFTPRLDEFTVLPLSLACATIPIWGLGQIQTASRRATTGRTSNWCRSTSVRWR
jgi:O-antigen/teichoic acid export membrane protein